METFEALELSAPILQAIEDQGFSAPTLIQQKAIPSLMEGKDLIGIAQTGGGKTAAFVVPLIEQLAKYETQPDSGKPRALILAPTRELAAQISDCIKLFSRHLKLKHGTIYGGTPYRQQMFMLQKGVDILVATPGRLLDHTRRGNIKFDETDFFVLDEADRMLDMGFVDDVSAISDMMSADRQTVMFSATMNHKVRELTKQLMIQPINVEISSEIKVAESIDHFLLQTDWRNKNDLLLHLIEAHSPSRMLIFTRTKGDADQVAMLLREQGHKSDAIHGDKKQRVRERVLNAFRNDRIQFLVATDVAARGIDVPDISHVVNMDMPLESENYVHRVGRTGRAGASGVAFSMCGRGDKGQLMAIERLIKHKIEVLADHPFHIELKGGGKGKPKGFKRGQNFKGDGPRRSFNSDGPRKSFKSDGPRKSYKSDGKRPARDNDNKSDYRPEFAKSRKDGESSFRSERSEGGEKSFRSGRRSEGKEGFKGRSERSEGGEKSFRSGRRSEGKEGFKGRSERSEGKEGFKGRSERSEGKEGFKGRSERSEGGERSFRSGRRSEGKEGFKGRSDRSEGYKGKSNFKGKEGYKGRSDRSESGEKSSFKPRSEKRSESGERSSFKPRSEKRSDDEKSFRHSDNKTGFKGKSDGGKPKFKNKGRARTADKAGNKPLKRVRKAGIKKAA